MLMTVRTSGSWYCAEGAGESWKSQHRLQILAGGLDEDGTQQTSGRSASSLKHTVTMATRPARPQTEVGSEWRCSSEVGCPSVRKVQGESAGTIQGSCSTFAQANVIWLQLLILDPARSSRLDATQELMDT